MEIAHFFLTTFLMAWRIELNSRYIVHAQFLAREVLSMAGIQLAL